MRPILGLMLILLVKESTHQGKSKMAQKYKKTFTNQDIYDDSKLSAQNGSKNSK